MIRLTLVLFCILLVTGSVASEPVAISGPSLPADVIAPQPIQDAHEIYYPPGAARCGLGGEVTLTLLIDKTGKVSEAQLVQASGFAWLDQAAVSSAQRWLYNPAMKDGTAIAARITTVVRFHARDVQSICKFLPPSAYSSGLPPGFSSVEPPDLTLLPNEKMLFQMSDRIEPEMLTSDRSFHVPDSGEMFRISYSLNPPSVHMRLLVVTDAQHRDENRGITPSGAYPMNLVVDGRGRQSVSLAGGDYWLVWIFADKPSDRIISYFASAVEQQ